MYEFRYTAGSPNAERKACPDCRHLKGAVTLWCTNKKAIAAHGTAMPRRILCQFWEPMLPADPPGGLLSRLFRFFWPSNIIEQDLRK